MTKNHSIVKKCHKNVNFDDKESQNSVKKTRNCKFR